MKNAAARQAPRATLSTDNSSNSTPHVLSELAPHAQELPIIIAKFWKNRKRNESVHVALSEYEGHTLIDVRLYCTGTDGIDRPTPKGVAMAVRKLPELADAVTKALAKARELGLLTESEP